MTTFKSAMSVCGLSQAETAEYLGLSIETVKHWSAGRRTVPEGIWKTMAELYDTIIEISEIVAENMVEHGIGAGIDIDTSAHGPLPAGALDAAAAAGLLIAIREMGGSE